MPGRRLPLLDADAFQCLRSLGLLEILKGRVGFRFYLTEYIARHDLCQLDRELHELERAKIMELPAMRVSASEVRRLRDAGVHKGEAEAIAWSLGQGSGTRPVFISNDRRAREYGGAEGIPVGDLLDLALELLECGLVTSQEARKALAPWDDRRQQQCKPKEWTGFDESVKVRKERPRGWSWQVAE